MGDFNIIVSDEGSPIRIFRFFLQLRNFIFNNLLSDHDINNDNTEMELLKLKQQCLKNISNAASAKF